MPKKGIQKILNDSGKPCPESIIMQVAQPKILLHHVTYPHNGPVTLLLISSKLRPLRILPHDLGLYPVHKSDSPTTDQNLSYTTSAKEALPKALAPSLLVPTL